MNKLRALWTRIKARITQDVSQHAHGREIRERLRIACAHPGIDWAASQWFPQREKAMPKRYENALAIQEGACNPSGIALAIVDACREVRDEGKQATTDAAVRLMTHQLAFICQIRQIDDDLSEYDRLTLECRVAAQSSGV